MHLRFGIILHLFGSYVTLFGLIVFLFNIFLSLISVSVNRSLTFKNENLVRILYAQNSLAEGVGFDYYDLVYYLYTAYMNETSYSFDSSEKKRLTDWIFLLTYAFNYFDVLLRSFPNSYKYSNYYESFQNSFYFIEKGVSLISGKDKQEQKFLDFFADLRN